MAIPICTSLFGKNCWKKFGTTIFGHSKFIPVLLGNIVRKRLEQTFLAIANLYQSFWEKLLEKIWNNHFWPFQIYTSLFGKNCWKKFRMAIFGHSKFVPVFLGKIVGKIIWNGHFWPYQIYTSPFGKHCQKKKWNIHFWPFLIYTSPFGKNCQKKIGTSIFHHSWFIPVLLGKILRKKLEQPFLAIPNLYQSSWEKLLEKNSEWPLLTNPNLYQSFWETLSEKDWNKHFWPFLVYTSLSGENCWKKFGTTIFGHSKFIPVLLGNIVRKRLEQTFLAIPNLYQSFWEKLLEKIWNNHFWPFQIYTSLFGKNCQKKFGMAIFWLCLIYTSLLGKNCQKKIGTTIFGHS